MTSRLPRRLGWLLPLFAGLAVPRLALADGGYYSGTLGARATGRGGAFVARADDLTAVSHNPAGLANLDDTRFELGNLMSYNAYAFTRAPTVDYGQAGNPTVRFSQVSNGKPWQGLDPMLGVSSRLGLRDWTFALAAYAPPGTSRMAFSLGNYPACARSGGLCDGGQRYMMLAREAMFLKYVAAAAWKYQDVFGVGATAEWIHVPRLHYSLVIDGTYNSDINPVSSTLDMRVLMKGSSLFTFNATLGAWYRPLPSLTFAVSGQVVPTNVVTKSTLTVTPLDSELGFGDVVLTRNGYAANDAKVTLPLPLVGRAGVRYAHSAGGHEVFDLELDIEYVTWSRVNRFSIETAVGSHDLVANYAGERVPLGRIDIEKHWRDTVAVRLGGDYAVLPGRLSLRAGMFYETAVADPAYANVDFSGGAQLGGALGASVFLSPFELAVAYMARVQPSFSVAEKDARVYQQAPGSPCREDPSTCNANLTGPTPTINAGTYRAHSHFLSLNLVYRYGR